MMRAFKNMLFFSVLFSLPLIAVNLFGESDEVEILIVDDFRGDESHGRFMTSIARKWSLGRCRVVEFQADSTKRDYLMALTKAATLLSSSYSPWTSPSCLGIVIK